MFDAAYYAMAFLNFTVTISQENIVEINFFSLRDQQKRHVKEQSTVRNTKIYEFDYNLLNSTSHRVSISQTLGATEHSRTKTFNKRVHK